MLIINYGYDLGLCTDDVAVGASQVGWLQVRRVPLLIVTCPPQGLLLTPPLVIPPCYD